MIQNEMKLSRQNGTHDVFLSSYVIYKHSCKPRNNLAGVWGLLSVAARDAKQSIV